MHTLRLLKRKGVNAYFSGCLTLTLKNRYKKRNDKIYLVDIGNETKKLLPLDIVEKSESLSHISRKKYFKFLRAKRLLKKYARAKLVITSRLHCALPCIAFGTPVIFINNNLKDPRFEGLLGYINHYSIKDIKEGKIKIDWSGKGNCKDISKLRKKLSDKCIEFIE
jgi:polysaccharide pyruvyl transferase WcaK-like protein